MTIELGLTEITLLPEKAAYLPKSRTLVVADTHIGKSATFRTRGIPIPEGDTSADLNQISELAQRLDISQLVIAGDLVHSRDGLTQDILAHLEEWLSAFPFPVILTEGNHDQRSWLGHFPLSLKTQPELELENLIITHDPNDLSPDNFGIAGHLHPGVRIKESYRRSLRQAGFFLKAGKHLILPSFSAFTGMQEIHFQEEDRFFAPLRDRVAEIPRNLCDKLKY